MRARRGHRLRKRSVERPLACGKTAPEGFQRLSWPQRYAPVLVVAAALAAYHGSFAGPFLVDDLSIEDSPELHRFWPPGALVGTTRPLVQLSLARNYALSGLDVAGYHAFNLGVHVLAALTLLGLVRRTLRTPPVAPRWGGEASGLALAVSLLWTAHPLQTESVTYVVQRAESLMALFYLLTLYCAVRGATSPDARRWYVAAVVACALGMVSKPVMVTAPIAVLLHDRVFLAGSWREAWRRRGGLYVGLAATWGLLALVLALPHESAGSAGFAMREITPLAYARSQPGVILHCLRLAVWPRCLVLDYGWPVASGPGAVVVPVLAVAALVGVTLWGLHRRPAIGFLGASFFLVLAPSSSIIPIKDLAFEHRMYLPLAALATLAVVGGAPSYGGWRRKSIGSGRWQLRWWSWS